MMDRSVFVAGAAGEGIQTIGDVIARTLLTRGYPVFAAQDYESRIRGGFSSVRLRIGDAPRNAPRPDADILLALNARAREQYREFLRPGGLLLADDAADVASVTADVASVTADVASVTADVSSVAIPFSDLALSHGGSKLSANSVAAGALCATLGVPFAALRVVLEETFKKRGADVVESNVRAAEAGFDAARTSLGSRALRELPARANRYAYASAHETIPLAAAAAGCRFIAAYPMSPSTGIITAFARQPELGAFVEQAEDEIAAINMALGAGAAGVRAMTATSGGGFALMVESLSLAGMTETPLVIVVGQRPGPATGLPTRTAQEDLFFAMYAGHGEAPRAVLAPSDPQDAIDKTIRAFDLADRYQIPVILLTDQFLADSSFSMEPFALPAEIPGPRLADPAKIARAYRRYALTDDGISPRLALGQSRHLVCIDSDEHDEDGHITEDLVSMRPAMVEKRLEKGRRLRAEMAPPLQNRAEDADLVLIGWGSTKGAIDEAVDRTRAGGHKVGALHFTELWPLPELAFPEGPRYWTVEGNATGQLARLLRAETGLDVEGRIGRYDGLPLDADAILKELPWA
jgi:2-oxoglutarate/2-oxoacid ferredoxin oxidoreductase subunit alpha